MTLEEIQKAFPIGCRIKLDYAREVQGVIVLHERYPDYPGERLSGHYYATYIRDIGLRESAWPENLVIIKPLSPLEQSISDYIAAEKKELGLNA